MTDYLGTDIAKVLGTKWRSREISFEFSLCTNFLGNRSMRAEICRFVPRRTIEIHPGAAITEIYRDSLLFSNHNRLLCPEVNRCFL